MGDDSWNVALVGQSKTPGARASPQNRNWAGHGGRRNAKRIESNPACCNSDLAAELSKQTWHDAASAESLARRSPGAMPVAPRRARCDLQCKRAVTQRSRVRCCRKRLCGACATKMLRADYARQRFSMACPFCRRTSMVTSTRVENLVAEHCPDHAKVLESEIGPVVVVRTLQAPRGTTTRAPPCECCPRAYPT